MVDITSKTYTLRKAIATAIVKVSKQETIDAIIKKKFLKEMFLKWQKRQDF
jgi:cyclic pyranopterin phosphate synthase